MVKGDGEARCDRCNWWVSLSPSEPGLGFCRGAPPQCMTGVRLALFPVTRERDYCGAFQADARPKPEPAE